MWAFIRQPASPDQASALDELILFGNELGAGLSHVLCDPNLTKTAASLTGLDLAACGIQDADALRLMNMLMDPVELPSLQMLGLGGNEVTSKDAWEDVSRSLQESRGGLRVVWM